MLTGKNRVISHLKILNHISKVLSLHKVTYPQVPVIRMRASVVAIQLLSHLTQRKKLHSLQCELVPTSHLKSPLPTPLHSLCSSCTSLAVLQHKATSGTLHLVFLVFPLPEKPPPSFRSRLNDINL